MKSEKLAFPNVCTDEITSGKTEQSSMNWQKYGFSGVQYLFMICCISGLSLQYECVKASSLLLVTSKAGQYLSIWVMSSIVLQFSDSWQFPEVLSQWLVSCWVLYLPQSIIAWHWAIVTLLDEAPAGHIRRVKNLKRSELIRFVT